MITIKNSSTWKSDIKLIMVGRTAVAVDSRLPIYREVYRFASFIARHKPSRLPL